MFVWEWTKAADATLSATCTLKAIEALSVGKEAWADAAVGVLVVTGPKTCPTGDIEYFENQM